MRRSSALPGFAMLALVAACGPVGAGPTASPGVPAGSSVSPGSTVSPGSVVPPSSSGTCEGAEPCSAPPTSAAGGVVLIHATFTGQYSDSLATADQTVNAEIVWKTGPDSIHDSSAFTFTSATFTFSESIGGVCGGTRSEAGPMNVQFGTTLTSGGPEEQQVAGAVMIDRRIAESALRFSLFSSFVVPNADAGCGDLSKSGVGSCPLIFRLVTLERLQEDAACEQSGTSWTGHLAQQ